LPLLPSLLSSLHLSLGKFLSQKGKDGTNTVDDESVKICYCGCV
jgi:hypothetical protein